MFPTHCKRYQQFVGGVTPRGVGNLAGSPHYHYLLGHTVKGALSANVMFVWGTYRSCMCPTPVPWCNTPSPQPAQCPKSLRGARHRLAKSPLDGATGQQVVRSKTQTQTPCDPDPPPPPRHLPEAWGVCDQGLVKRAMQTKVVGVLGVHPPQRQWVFSALPKSFTAVQRSQTLCFSVQRTDT